MPSPSKRVAAASAAIAAHDRTKFIGGSDAAAILGISPWSSRYRLWCLKMGIEVAPDLSEVDYIYFGHLLEPLVAQVFSERTGMQIRSNAKLFTHKKYPFIGGHVDREILKQKAFLECKTANAFDFAKWGKSETGVDGVPDYYVSQVDHYMMVRESTHCYVAALIGGNDFRWYRIERDEKREAILLKEELIFWDMVVSKKTPDVISERDAKHRWAKIVEGTAIQVDKTARKKIVQLASVTSKIKTLEAEEKELRDFIFPLFQDKEMLADGPEALARLNPYNRSYFDLDAFRAKNKKTAAKYTEKKLSKRLKILI